MSESKEPLKVVCCICQEWVERPDDDDEPVLKMVVNGQVVNEPYMCPECDRRGKLLAAKFPSLCKLPLDTKPKDKC